MLLYHCVPTMIEAYAQGFMDIFEIIFLLTTQIIYLLRQIQYYPQFFQDETTNIISDLRDEISRIRNKIAKSTDGGNKEDVLRMQVSVYYLDNYLNFGALLSFKIGFDVLPRI